MIFFSVQKFLKGNLKGSFVVKVFLMGITILDRRILFVKFWLWRALKVESRPSDLPPRYVFKFELKPFDKVVKINQEVVEEQKKQKQGQ